MSTPLPPLSAAELKALLATPSPPRLLDVREPHEFVSEDSATSPAPSFVPLGTVANNVARFAGEQRDIVVICRSGMRAGQAADFLAKQGLKTRVLTGGMLAWNEAKLPISRDPQ